METVTVDFMIKVQNKTKDIIDSVQIKDDLTTTFNRSTGFTLGAVELSGALYKK